MVRLQGRVSCITPSRIEALSSIYIVSLLLAEYPAREAIFLLRNSTRPTSNSAKLTAKPPPRLNASETKPPSINSTRQPFPAVSLLMSSSAANARDTFRASEGLASRMSRYLPSEASFSIVTLPESTTSIQSAGSIFPAEKSRMEQPSKESSFASSPSSIPLNSGQLHMALRSSALILISVMVSSNG